MPRIRGGYGAPHQRGGGSGDPQERPKFDLSKMIQIALYTALWGQILSFWPFWTSHWAQEGHCCSTWAIYDLGVGFFPPLDTDVRFWDFQDVTGVRIWVFANSMDVRK